jgi:hypothetical protein
MSESVVPYRAWPVVGENFTPSCNRCTCGEAHVTPHLLPCTGSTPITAPSLSPLTKTSHQPPRSWLWVPSSLPVVPTCTRMSSDYEASGLHDAATPIGLVVLPVLNCPLPFASRSSASTRVVVEAMTAAMVQSPPLTHTRTHNGAINPLHRYRSAIVAGATGSSRKMEAPTRFIPHPVHAFHRVGVVRLQFLDPTIVHMISISRVVRFRLKS